jgi:aryl-alcohol dehydrogenase-like predicted oxidoreductase
MGGEWLGPSELRIGLGCMRLADERAEDTIAAAAEAGVTVFDTARAYGDGPGTGERLLARGLRACGAHQRSRIVTKGGMTRVAEAWVPDGRAKAIRADCEASLEALDGLPIDLYLLHAPDPRTPWKTSIRALAGLLDERLIARVGLSNVNRRQLDEALELAPITAVEVALSPYDDHAWRGGLLERCAEQEIAVIAHSPLGGPRRAGRLVRSTPLVEVARARGVQPAQVALAWLLALSHNLVAIPGARRPETARSAARAAGLELEAEELTALEHAFGRFATYRARSASAGAPILTDGEVVLIMGIPGAGKTRAAEAYLARGYVRMNRDERGGGLRDLADALSRELASGASRVVLDNTYLSRAARHYVIEAAPTTASRHAASGSTRPLPRPRSTSCSGWSSASGACRRRRSCAAWRVAPAA